MRDRKLVGSRQRSVLSFQFASSWETSVSRESYLCCFTCVVPTCAKPFYSSSIYVILVCVMLSCIMLICVILHRVMPTRVRLSFCVMPSCVTPLPTLFPVCAMTATIHDCDDFQYICNWVLNFVVDINTSIPPHLVYVRPVQSESLVNVRLQLTACVKRPSLRNFENFNQVHFDIWDEHGRTPHLDFSS